MTRILDCRQTDTPTPRWTSCAFCAHQVDTRYPAVCEGCGTMDGCSRCVGNGLCPDCQREKDGGEE